MSDYSIKEVKDLIDESTFYVSKLMQKDKGKQLRSKIYKFFNIVYDEHDRRVPTFYVCPKCNIIKKIIQSKSGNSWMTRHPCYTEYLDDVRNGAIVESHDDEEEGAVRVSFDSVALTPSSKTILSKTIATLSEIFVTAGKRIDTEMVKQLLPTSWNNESW